MSTKDINEAHIHVKCIECGEALIEYTPDITFRDVDMAIAAHESNGECKKFDDRNIGNPVNEDGMGRAI